MLLQVPLHQEFSIHVNQVVLEGLGVLGQADVVEPGLGHPVMVQVRGFGQAGEERHSRREWDGWERWQKQRDGEKWGRDDQREKQNNGVRGTKSHRDR